MMHRARILLASLIALSVAMLPMAGLASVSVAPTDEAMSAAMTNHSDMSAAMEDCCPPYAKLCDQNNDHCQSAACAFQTVTIANVAAAPFEYPAIATDPLSNVVDQVVSPHGGSPPFRPPRV